LTSITCGAIELRVLGSQLVHRIRETGSDVSPRVVRRIVVASYLEPRDAALAATPSRLAGARLLAKWTRDSFPVFRPDRSVRRTARASRAIAALDLSSIGAREPPTG
jgi:hypothetical protein